MKTRLWQDHGRVWRTAFAVLLALVAGSGYSIELTREYIKASEGPIVPGEWNKRFSDGLAYADAHNVPLVVFFGGLSCGVCEALQKACLTEEFTTWQQKRKPVLIFTTSNTYGNAHKFAMSELPDAESGFPNIAAYWNRDGVAPAKHTQYYVCFRGKDGQMPVKGGTLASQLSRSLDLVMGEYPYGGGEFLLSDSATTRLEIEAGYAPGTKVRVPLTRTGTDAYVNRLVCGGKTNSVSWAAGEKGVKYAEVVIPDGQAAGTAIAVKLLSSAGTEHAASSVAVVAPQPNSPRNPAWLGEDFAAGDWTMDLDAVKSRMAGGDFRNALVLFTGALWCPHCQGLERDVLSKPAFRSWCEANQIALVELDNPKRSDASSPEKDYQIAAATGAPPTLLRYAPGSNSFAGREESGASYLTRKGIAVGTATTAGTAEWVLQRNRDLGYARVAGSYCAPGAGRCGYPTLILLKADGSVAGRLNRLEGDDYAHDAGENMARLDELLKLSAGDGERDLYAQTTTRELSAGGAAVSADLQVNARTVYFKLTNLPTGRVTFQASGAPADNPVRLHVVRLKDGAVSELAGGEGAVTCSFAGDADCLLAVQAFDESRAYGRDSGFTATVSSSLVLVPAEKTAAFTPGTRGFALSLTKGETYRLEGFATPDPAALRDAGAAEAGGRLYTALATGDVVLAAEAAEVRYQIWRPGTVSFDVDAMTAFTFQGRATVSATRASGSSGAVSVRVKVMDGGAPNGVRYVWNDATELSWADGESGTRRVTFELKKAASPGANESFTLQFVEATGPAASAVSDGTLTVDLCDTDKPVPARTSYAVDLFATFDAAGALDAQEVFNVKDGKVAVKKVDGKLPAGVKLVYENGVLRLAGSTKKTGSFTYVFRLEQRQDGALQVGPDVTLTLDVAAASSVAAGGNALFGKKIQATLPLYEDVDGTRYLRGVLEFKQDAKNKITAKYCGLAKKKVSIKGLWERMEAGAAETGVLQAKSGQKLRLSLDAAGHVAAELTDPVYAAPLTTGGGLRLGTGAYATGWTGAYTVALEEKSADDVAGHASFVVKSLTDAGKAKWSGVLPNGQTVSGSAYVTRDDEDCAVLPVFVYRSKDWLAAAVRLRRDGASLYFPRAVRSCPGTLGAWSHHAAPASLHLGEVYGSFYDSRNGALDRCCYDQFFQDTLLFRAQLDGFTSGKYGAATSAAQAEVRVLPDALKLETRSPDIKLSFAKKTGVFKGSMAVQFGAKTVKAKFQGVVLPGWHDCGCEGPTDGEPFGIVESLPFSLGAAWISDTWKGASVRRGFKVRIDE